MTSSGSPLLALEHFFLSLHISNAADDVHVTADSFFEVSHRSS